ncbi:alcohol dehydrogenase catalytic domain-containing protein [Lacrimispora sp.]|uniref:alcohol dehydrogenase catalytic domain-containing protein n=1 Tax=Lacrimispora sp. TaxID=2719234 RepID=UPI0028A88E85|nr:alcohol dehydrogenase catalytic domain-containing protein [Lacrimispora sp.]
MEKVKMNHYWPYGGTGIESFGANDVPDMEIIPEPGDYEVLAKVDAYAICASDVKMIQMGNDYPLFKDRDFEKQPARLGHELSLTVVRPGRNMEKDWPVGTRFGVQPDVYLNGERYCIGVNKDGGMAEYLLLGAEVFKSDFGSCAFEVVNDLSFSSVAQTEPVACVEAAFTNHTRNEIREEDEVLLWIDEETRSEFDVHEVAVSKKVSIYDKGNLLSAVIPKGNKFEYGNLEELADRLFDVIVVIGNPQIQTMTTLTECLNPGSIFAWLPEKTPCPYVEMDIAKIHYNKINLSGTMTRSLTEALSCIKYRCDYKPGGDLIISGGGGAMGRIHVMRALQHEAPPGRIIVTNLGEERLLSLRETFGTLALEKGIELITLDIGGKEYEQQIRKLAGENGVSDIVVCAPGVAPLNGIVEFLAADGMLVLFAGTSYGQFGRLPLGLVSGAGVSITASSGSGVKDQLSVVDKMKKGIINPDINIAAIGGLDAGKEGIRAVKEGRYAGKVIIYPVLRDLPLTAIEELDKIDAELALYVKENGWSRRAEKILFKCIGNGVR